MQVMRLAIPLCLLTQLLATALHAQPITSIPGACTIITDDEASLVIGLPIREEGSHETWVVPDQGRRTACRFRADTPRFLHLSAVRIDFLSEKIAQDWLKPDGLRRERNIGHEVYSYRKPGMAEVLARKGKVVVMLTFRAVRTQENDAEVSDQQFQRMLDMMMRISARW
jgi:hypothetical protein